MDRARGIIAGSGALRTLEAEIASATSDAVSGLRSAPLRPDAKVALEHLALAAAQRSR